MMKIAQDLHVRALEAPYLLGGLARTMRMDYHTHRARWIIEVLGTLITLTASTILALTTPVPPMLLLYILWNAASVCLLYAAVNRGSFGLSCVFAGFLLIDSIGLWRTWIA